MHEALDRIRANLALVIKGKAQCIELLLATLLARGHVLIEDRPGLGKTTLAKSLARSLDARFSRIQFTPDLLPTDILGGSVYNPKDGSFTFHQGPIFTNILLADEINRASPRTQSSLLEAMAESQATIEGVRHPLPPLFMVIATENPIEFHGTYPLPEAQLDRFLIRMGIGYPDADTEVEVLYDQRKQHPIEKLRPVATADEIHTMQEAVGDIHVADEIGRYIVAIARATRSHPRVQMGVSPRGSLGMFRLSQALALLTGRDHVLPDDVQAAAGPVLAHRIMLETKAKYSGTDRESLIEEVVHAEKVPV